jgi:hypothetical protein
MTCPDSDRRHTCYTLYPILPFTRFCCDPYCFVYVNNIRRRGRECLMFSYCRIVRAEVKLYFLNSNQKWCKCENLSQKESKSKKNTVVSASPHVSLRSLQASKASHILHPYILVNLKIRIPQKNVQVADMYIEQVNIKDFSFVCYGKIVQSNNFR